MAIESKTWKSTRPECCKGAGMTAACDKWTKDCPKDPSPLKLDKVKHKAAMDAIDALLKALKTAEDKLKSAKDTDTPKVDPTKTLIKNWRKEIETYRSKMPPPPRPMTSAPNLDPNIIAKNRKITESNIKDMLSKIKTNFKLLEGDLGRVKADATETERKKFAKIFDDTLTSLVKQQDSAGNIGLNINSECTSCIEHAKKCWLKIGKVPYNWNAKTKNYTSSWQMLVFFETDEGKNLEDLKGQKPYDMQKVGEAKFMDDQTGHWTTMVVAALNKATTEFIQLDCKNKVDIERGEVAAFWQPIKDHHTNTYKLKTSNANAFGDAFKAGEKGRSKLLNECIQMWIATLKKELKSLTEQNTSKLLTSNVELDYEDADEHWSGAMQVNLAALLNNYLTMPAYLAVKPANPGKIVDDLFAPIKSEHANVFNPAKHGMHKKANDMPPEMQKLFTKAKSHLEQELKNVLTAEKSNSLFIYSAKAAKVDTRSTGEMSEKARRIDEVRRQEDVLSPK